MIDYNSYSAQIDSLKANYANYQKLYSSLQQVKNPMSGTDIKINDFVQQKQALDQQISESTNKINTYYNKKEDGIFSSLFASAVWFKDSSDTETIIKEISDLKIKVEKELQELPGIQKEKELKKLNNKLFKDELSKIDEQLGQLTTEDIEHFKMMKTVDSEIRTLKSEIPKIEGEIKKIESDTSRTKFAKSDLIQEETKNLSNRQLALKEKESQRDILKKNMSQSAYLAVSSIKILRDTVENEIDAYFSKSNIALPKEFDDLAQKLNLPTKNELEVKIGLYGHKNNIPLAKEFHDLEQKINVTTGEMKDALNNHYKENVAALERTRKIDPYFNFLMEIREELAYRSDNNKVGTSPVYQAAKKYTEVLETSYSKNIDALVKNNITDETVGKSIATLLNQRIDFRTWSLLSKDQQQTIFQSVHKNVLEGKSYSDQINDLEGQLASYKKIRESKY